MYFFDHGKIRASLFFSFVLLIPVLRFSAAYAGNLDSKPSIESESCQSSLVEESEDSGSAAEIERIRIVPVGHRPLVASVIETRGRHELVVTDDGNVLARMAFEYEGENLIQIHEILGSRGQVRLELKTDRREYAIDLQSF
jgi:hypothetical protein